MKSFLSRVAVLLVTTVLSITAGCQPRPEAPSGAQVPDAPPPPAPDPAWSLSRVDGGPPVSLESLKGRPAVLYYYAPWTDTGPSRAELLNALPESIQVYPVAVDRAGTDPLPPTLAGRPVLRGDSGAVAAFGGIRAMPTAVVLDANGATRAVLTGHVPAADIIAATVP